MGGQSRVDAGEGEPARLGGVEGSGVEAGDGALPLVSAAFSLH